MPMLTTSGYSRDLLIEANFPTSKLRKECEDHARKKLTRWRFELAYLIGPDAKLSSFLKRNLPDRWMDAIIFLMFGLQRWVKRQEDSNVPTEIKAVSRHPTHK